MEIKTDYKEISKNVIQNHITDIVNDILRINKKIRNLRGEIDILEADLNARYNARDSLNKAIEIIEKS